jgi:hypothetical protein
MFLVVTFYHNETLKVTLMTFICIQSSSWYPVLCKLDIFVLPLWLFLELWKYNISAVSPPLRSYEYCVG